MARRFEPDEPVRLKMGVYVSGQRTGYLKQQWLPQDDGALRIEAEVDATLSGWVGGTSVFAEMAFDVDPKGKLSTMSVDLERPLFARMRGRVRSDGIFLAVTLGETRLSRFLPLDTGDVLNTTLTPVLTLPPLQPGVQWEMAQFDPLTRQIVTVWMKVEGRDVLVIEEGNVPCYTVSIRSNYMAEDPADKIWVWVTEEEDILQIEKPGFYKFVREPWPEDEAADP
jgi:hypothetical protein